MRVFENYLSSYRNLRLFEYYFLLDWQSGLARKLSMDNLVAAFSIDLKSISLLTLALTKAIFSSHLRGPGRR